MGDSVGGDFVMGDFVTGDFVIINFGTHKIWGILSQVNFSLGNFLMRDEGFCHGDFVTGNFVVGDFDPVP